MQHTKRILYYTVFTTILNLSIQPVHAVHTNQNYEQEVFFDKTHPSSRLLVSENSPQEKPKASATGQSWMPQFIQDLTSQAYTRMASLLGTETTDSLDSLREYFEEDFSDEIEYFKTYKPSQHDLTQLQDRVWKGEISPYQYVRGLKELEPFISKTLLKKVQNKFQKNIKSFPLFLEWNFQKELISCVKESNLSQQSIADFENLLTYYRQIINPLDYTESLVGFRRHIQREGKNLNLTDQTYRFLNEETIKAIKQRDEKRYKVLKAERQQFIKFAKEIPYYGEDVSGDIFNSSLSSVSNVKEESVNKDNSKPSILNQEIGQSILEACKKGTHFILKHPLQAITMGLFGQVVATAAIGNEFQISANGQFPAVASLQNGNVFVAYSNTPQFNIYGRVYNNTGFPLTNELLLTNITGVPYPSSVSSLSNGNVFVGWSSYPQGDIYGRIYDGMGQPLTSDLLLSSDTTLDFGPSVTTYPNGNIFVSWYSNYNVFGRLLNEGGIALTNEFLLTNMTGSESSVSSLPNGNIFATWSGTTNPGSIYGRLFDGGGFSLTSDLLLNPTGSYSTVSTFPNGNLCVAWTNDTDIYGQILNEQAVPLSSDIFLSSGTNNGSYPPFSWITAFPTGNMLAVWDFYLGGDIYGRVFNGTGSPLTSPVVLNTMPVFGSGGNNLVLSLASLSNGNAFMAWRVLTNSTTGDCALYGSIIPVNTFINSTTASFTTGGTLTTSQTSMTSLISTGATGIPVSSNSQKLSPSWLVSPVKGITNVFERLWEFIKNKT